MNPFTGGMNNPTFGSIDLDGDGLKDLFVFDRDADENQFLLFKALKKNALVFRYVPQFESAFPSDLHAWSYLADYNGDGLPDIFTHSVTNSTGIKVYRNTSYIDPISKKYKLQFTAYRDTLFFSDSSKELHEVDVPSNSNPVFVDVDRDGFLDILSMDVSLNNVQYFRNQGISKDSLKYYFTKRCWGYFQESGKHLYTPWNCEKNNAYTGQWDPKYKTGAHGYSSICALDVDGDGDLDMLIGDGGNDSLALLKNGFETYKKDTIVNISETYNNNNFPVDQPALISTMPTPSALDVNNDGLTDLLVSSGMPTDTDTYHSSRVNNIWYYQNDGDSANTVFRLHAQDFLENTTVDWGLSSAPCFVDVDKDGRKDLIVAVRDGGGKRGCSHAILYLNKPGKNGGKPYLLYQDNDYMGLSSLPVPIMRPVPSPYTNGKDGKTDLVVGDDSGRVMYFKDMSSGTHAANFKMVQSALQYVTQNGLQPIDVGYNSAPTSADINHDGMTDLLIGANNGAISYYRCLGYTGTNNIPYFQLVTNTFGGINTVPGQDFQSAPCVADLDKDGKADLLVGDRFGRLFYYHDFDTVGTLKASTQSLLYDYRTSQRYANKLFSTYVIPAVANLDQDSFPDIMLGCRRGGLIFLGSYNNGFESLLNTGVSEPITPMPVNLKLYPNPANDYFTLGYTNPVGIQAATIKVYDVLGREFVNKPFEMGMGQGKEQVSTSGLKDGLYIVNIVENNHLLYSEKIIIHKQY